MRNGSGGLRTLAAGSRKRFWTVPDSARATRAATNSLRAKTVISVAYFHSSEKWPRGYRVDRELHEPEMAVVINTSDNVSYVAIWRTVGADCLLELVETPIKDYIKEEGISVNLFDASDLEPWDEILGATIDRIDVAETVSEDGYLTCVSTILHMSCGWSIKISLGEWKEGEAQFSADSLTVEFRRRTGRVGATDARHPTVDVVREYLSGMVAGNVFAKEASDWADQWIGEEWPDCIHVGLEFLSLSEPLQDGSCLHGKGDYVEWLEEFDNCLGSQG